LESIIKKCFNEGSGPELPTIYLYFRYIVNRIRISVFAF